MTKAARYLYLAAFVVADGGPLWTLVQLLTHGTCYLVTGSCVCSA